MTPSVPADWRLDSFDKEAQAVRPAHTGGSRSTKSGISLSGRPCGGSVISADRTIEQVERQAIQAEGRDGTGPGLPPDLRHTRAFIECLTGSADSHVTFQTFDDTEEEEKNPELVRILHGSIDQCATGLERLNAAGAGVFITVNETDLTGRKARNVVAVRALFADFDEGPPDAFALDPSFTVSSVRGPHAYWLLKPGVPCERFEPAQQQIIAFYGSDPVIHDLPRVMRLPGFFHRKAEPVLIMFTGGSLELYDIDRVLAAHPARSPNRAAGQETPRLDPASVLAGAPKGARDDSLFRYACSLRANRRDRAEAETLILAAARACRPPFHDRVALEKVERAWMEYPAGTDGGRGPSEMGSRPTVANLVKLSSVTRKKVEWLWYGRIARGKITDLFGDGDLGKSTMLTDIAARVTRGRGLPDETEGSLHDPRTVIVLTAEDGIEDTLKARFDEAGGDGDRLEVLVSVTRADGKRDLLSLTLDIEALVDACRRTNAALCTIDPFSAYLGKADAWKDQEVRRVLGSLKEGIEPIGTAVILLRHPPKGRTENPMHAGGGSVAISAACRTGLMVVKDSADTDRRLLATYKHNLTKEMSTLAFRLRGSPSDPETAIVEWEVGTDPRDARQLLAEGGQTYEQRSAIGDARSFLKDFLAEGPQPAETVKAEAAKIDISNATLRRAYDEIGAKPKKDGMTGPWLWRLK